VLAAHEVAEVDVEEEAVQEAAVEEEAEAVSEGKMKNGFACFVLTQEKGVQEEHLVEEHHPVVDSEVEVVEVVVSAEAVVDEDEDSKRKRRRELSKHQQNKDKHLSQVQVHTS
jgi:hypothetical protein